MDNEPSDDDALQQQIPAPTQAEALIDGEKVEVALQPESEPAGSQQPAYFEPGRYADISNAAYHAANGISSTHKGRAYQPDVLPRAPRHQNDRP
ncbi:hypothetical protein M8494_14820 [Serratia ureilytica]